MCAYLITVILRNGRNLFLCGRGYMKVFVSILVNSFYMKPEKGPSFKKFLYSVSIYQIGYKLLYAFFWVIPRCLNFVPTFRNTLFHLHRCCKLPAYTACEDGTECSETSEYKIQTPGNHLKERIHSKHGEILKSRRYKLSFYGVWWTTS